ncbi:uncharacterized protein LOC134535230 [Bacillus rossius redtenbacheri]|uniref:uncharacterized protein LOC134535230 n=1 Tax=Bacillus rossius redtenbacheri TaxID=93214 RepID=UPI002FDE4BFF
MTDALLLAALLAGCQLLQLAAGQNCTDAFIKVSGYAPSDDTLILLYSQPGAAVTAECFRRCRSSSNCRSLVIDYQRSACFRVNASSYLPPEIEVPPVVTARRASFFQRACLQVPRNCSGRLWAATRAPGYELVGQAAGPALAVDSVEQCVDRCLTATLFPCRSAVYTPPTYSSRGRCSLSFEDRRSQPDAYRATPVRVQYLEVECLNATVRGQTCSYEEFPNNTLGLGDADYWGLTKTQCQGRCDAESQFNCRALTWVARPGGNSSLCRLHGDDLASAGPAALLTAPGAAYLEKIPCLDLLVTCSGREMSVTLRTLQPFTGRMYVRGRPETCGAEGRGSGSTVLTVPLESPSRAGRVDNKCGVLVVKSVGETNRTLLSAVVIIQNNPIIQRRGDRAVKIGCLLEGVAPQNVTLGTSLTFPDTESLPGAGAVVVNSSAPTPTVRLHIYDLSRGDAVEATETQLGQSLQFRIDVDPADSPYDIKAAHLVATSDDGSDSYLLLDERGCPPDPLTFPAFVRAAPRSRSLVANFRAFKFPRSFVVRFNVMVRFCPGACEPTDCGAGVLAYGRRRRAADDAPASLYQQLPMQRTLVVRNPQLAAGSVLQQRDPDNSNILLLVPEEPGAVCLYYGAIIGLVMAWMLLQLLLLVGCYFTARQRKLSRRERDQLKLQDDFHAFENHRHVHWADQSS